MFHLHKWSDWAVKESGKVVERYSNSSKIGSYITQERFCPKCGKTQIETQKTVIRNDVVLIPDTKKTLPTHDKVR